MLYPLSESDGPDSLIGCSHTEDTSRPDVLAANRRLESDNEVDHASGNDDHLLRNVTGESGDHLVVGECA